jgi:hypothetical protein
MLQVFPTALPGVVAIGTLFRTESDYYTFVEVITKGTCVTPDCIKRMDEVLDALGHNLVNGQNAIVLAIIRGATRNIEDPPNHGFGPPERGR